MKRIALLLLVVSLILSGCVIATPTVTPSPDAATPEPTVAAEPTTAPVVQDGLYTDPNGLFTAQVPTNWTATQADGYGIITAPDESINAYLLALPLASDDETGEDAIARAWALIDPTFALPAADVTEVPDTGSGPLTVITYDTSETDATRFVQAVAQVSGGIAYIQIYDGGLVAIQQRAAQVQIIFTSFTITAQTPDDLTNVPPLALTDEMVTQLESDIARWMELLEVPGAAVAIVMDNEIVYSSGFGVKEMGGTEPVDAETQMMIGSTSKTMTTMLMAQLVDAGVLQWDQKVVDILPTFALADPDRTQQIEVQHLVCACTGVPRRDYEWLLNADSMTAEKVVEDLATYDLFTDFGEAFQYSNQMVAAGGYIAALASGAEWGNLYAGYVQLMQAQVFDAIGMPLTTFSFTDVEARGNFATPHGMDVFGDYYVIPLATEELLLPIAPAGAAWSTVIDLANYMITELNQGVAPDGTRVVSAENLAYTWQPQVQISADSSYGLGWIIAKYKGLPILAHGGNTFGFTTELDFLPGANLGIVILTNARLANTFTQLVASRFLELIYGQEPEADAGLDFVLQQSEEQVAELRDKTVDVDPADVEAFLGTYTNAALGEITLALEDGRFIVDMGEFQAEIKGLLNDEGEFDSYFLIDSPGAGTPVELNEDDMGSRTVVVGTGIVEYTFTPVE